MGGGKTATGDYREPAVVSAVKMRGICVKKYEPRTGAVGHAGRAVARRATPASRTSGAPAAGPA